MTGHRWATGADGPTCARCNGLQASMAGRPCPADEDTRMDQHLIDYTVRNIMTGDEEDIRVLELTPDEMLGFPEPVRDEAIALIDDAQQTGSHWATNQAHILDLLLPYISNHALFDADYEAWERKVLGDERILDGSSPEDVAIVVSLVLKTAADAAIENWDDGFWEDFHPTTTRRELLENFVGFIQAWLEVDDPDFELPLIEPAQDC
jgi:hypothetical protein